MSTLLFIGGLGGWEILLIIAIILIFFGAKKIPELARGLGTGMREFKNATTEIKKEVERDSSQEPKPNTASKTNPSTESTTVSSVETRDQKPETEEEDRK